MALIVVSFFIIVGALRSVVSAWHAFGAGHVFHVLAWTVLALVLLGWAVNLRKPVKVPPAE